MNHLDADSIVDAAIALMEDRGPDAVSMRALAARFDVTPMALYRYFSDKDSLLLAVVGRISDHLSFPALDSDPTDRATSTAIYLHDFLVEYPWLIRLITTGRLASPAGLRFPEIFISCGIEAGLNDDDAFTFYRTMFASIVGQAVYTSARGHENNQANAVAQANQSTPTVQRLSERWQSLDQQASPATIFRTLASALLARPTSDPAHRKGN